LALAEPTAAWFLARFNSLYHFSPLLVVYTPSLATQKLVPWLYKKN